MKAIIFSDIHLKLSQTEPKGTDGKLIIPILEFIKEEISRHNVKYFFNLGDTFHNKDKTSATLLQIYREFLESINEDVQIIQIVGNHDFSVVSEQHIYHSLKQYIDLDNITLVDDIYRLDEDNVFMGYCRTKEQFESRISRLGGAKRLFSHLDLNGFNLGDSYVEHKTFLNMEDLEKFQQVFLGHYHEAQEKIKNGLQVVYVGSSETTEFGESDQEKRYLLLDLESGTYKSIPTKRTFHKTIQMNHDEEFPIIPEEEIKRGVKYRVSVKGTKEEIKNSLLRKPKEYPALIKRNYVFETHSERLKINTQNTKEDYLEKYLNFQLKTKFDTELNDKEKEKLLEKGHNLLEQARNS